jgi:hypothetical protein
MVVKMNKPNYRTLTFLDFFEVKEYLRETRNVDLRLRVWDFLIDFSGLRNDSYVWCPPYEDDDYMDDLESELVNDLRVLYEEFPDEDGLMFHVSW